MKRIFLSTLTAFGLFASSLVADVIQNQIVSTSTLILKVFNQDYNGTSSKHKLPKRFERKNIKAVAIVPDLIKGGLIVTGQKGEGIFVVKNSDGTWSDPLFIDIKGLGIGVQAGYISNDAILLFDNHRSYTGLFEESKTIEIGGDASIGGGESRHHGTDLPRLGANVLALGRSDGIFIGMNLNSANIKVNDQNNIDYYQRMFQDRDIINGSPRDSKYTKELKKILKKTFDRR